MKHLSTWKGKRVFITGHTGFKGSWLAHWLLELGATVKGYSLSPATKPNLFSLLKLNERVENEINDVRNQQALKDSIKKFNPNFIFHLAAQPLVRASYKDPADTYSTNVMGTVNLLDAAREASQVQGVLVITTDKCYENKEWPWPYREGDTLGGYDPYSSSKACAELVTSSYRQSFFNERGINLATARAGNVIGGGDWAEDRLIPDLIRAIDSQQELFVRSPNAVRPWQHVLDPLNGYLQLGSELMKSSEFSEAWNFGPNEGLGFQVQQVLSEACDFWGVGAKWKIAEFGANLHETHLLRLDSSKARTKLGWLPRWSTEIAIEETMRWYKEYSVQPDKVISITTSQIAQFCEN